MINSLHGKILLLSLVTVAAFFSTAAGFQVSTPTENITVESNTWKSASIDIGLDQHETATLSTIKTPKNTSVLLSDQSVKSNKKVKAYILTQKIGWSTKKVKINVSATASNIQTSQYWTTGGPLFSLDHSPVEKVINVTYNGSTLPGSKYTVMSDVLSVDTDKITNYSVSDGVGIYYTYSGGSSGSKTITYTLNAKQVPDERKALLQILSSKPYNRGDYLNIKVIDNIENDPIRGCTVKAFGSGETSTLDLVGTSTGQIKIPEKVQGNSYTFQVSTCPDPYNSGYTKTIQLTTWQEYRNKHKLMLTNVETGFGKISGKVTNLNGKAITTNAKVRVSDGTTMTRKTNTNGRFSFNINSSGNYTVQALRTDLGSSVFDSETKKVNVKIDTDNDKVPDSIDVCPNEEGSTDSKGCLPNSTSITLRRDGKTVEKPGPGQYTIALTSNGETVNTTGTMKIKTGNSARNVELESGTASVTLDETGEYTFTWSGSPRYKESELTKTVKNRGYNPLKLMFLGAVLVLAAGGAYILLQRRSGIQEEEVSFKASPGQQEEV